MEVHVTVHKVKDTNLIADVLDDWGSDAVTVISDIPPITDTKFKKLLKLSFPAGSKADEAEILSPNLTDDPSRDEWIDNLGDMRSRVKTWKEFVAQTMKDYPDPDDFSE